MKKMVFVISLVVLTMSLVFAGGAKEATEKKPTIAMIPMVMVGDPFQVTMAEEAKRVGELMGFNVIINAASAHGRADEQVSIIEDFIAQKVDGILISCLDPNIVVPAIKKANAAGIPVITVDGGANGGDVVTHIATDNIKGSYVAGQTLVEGLAKKGITSGKILQIEGEAGSKTAADRKAGFHQRIGEETGLYIVASLPGHFTTPGATQVMEDVLQAHPDLVGVFASSDMMAVGAAQVISRAGKADQITLVSYDGIIEGIDLVERGASYADVAQYPKKMAKMGVEILAEIVFENKDPNSFDSFIDSGVGVVTKDNVVQFKADNL